MAKTRAPERVASGVYRADAVGFPNAISVLLLENDDGWTLVDTDLGSSVGPHPRRFGHVRGGASRPQAHLPKHQTGYTGGLPGLLEWSPEVELGTTEHEAEIVFCSAGSTSVQTASFAPSTGGCSCRRAGRQGTLREGDLVSGFHVILRPGHTSGHASLLRDENGLLFTGDAFGAVALRRIRVGVARSSAQTPTVKTLRGEAALGGV